MTTPLRIEDETMTRSAPPARPEQEFQVTAPVALGDVAKPLPFIGNMPVFLRVRAEVAC